MQTLESVTARSVASSVYRSMNALPDVHIILKHSTVGPTAFDKRWQNEHCIIMLASLAHSNALTVHDITLTLTSASAITRLTGIFTV
jgi:Fe2+ or Zn2+ uptake regulation protein